VKNLQYKYSVREMLEQNDTSNSMGKWNHLGINQKIPEQQNGKA
jgi:hypothetical protein